jgi:SAM-dependent methyltransferase
MKFSTFFAFAKPKYLFKNRWGFCTVCGHTSVFLLSDELSRIRNNALCVRCGSVSRHRHVAKCIVEHFRGRGITRLEDFGSHPELSVYNSVSSGPIVKHMGAHANIICAEYFDNVPPGGSKNGVRCENFEALSFGSGTLDLVISEDVFEHLKDYKKGFSEVYRVLRTGGAHIFSIPFYVDRKTEVLMEFKGGREIPLCPIEYHGDPIRGRIPAYTRFGRDLFDLLENMGYDVRLDIAGYEDEMRYAAFDCATFITVKK